MTALARSVALPGDEVFVLHDRPLRDGAAVGETSQFGDDVWRLQPAIHKSSGRNLILNFNRFPVRFRPVAKQLAYAMLSGPLPQGEKRCKNGTRHQAISDHLERYVTSGRPLPGWWESLTAKSSPSRSDAAEGPWTNPPTRCSSTRPRPKSG
ncbi:hypothetical protein CQW44_34925 [Streptomyces griseofuscus]|uniref:Uncharacterized protein n=1 Tax=Streptomyces griseofuscus TaxID=146922 RepID=A0A426RWT7_9ACTN|nr:hypothetical protein CQW44_34925 [Streptomyces griseofuscus]